MTNSIFTQENKDLTVLTDIAYQDFPVKQYGDWKILYTSDQTLTNLNQDQKDGYFGIAVKNTKTNEVRAVHRGSDQFIPLPETNLGDDLDDDNSIYQQQIPDQYAISRQFINKISELENIPKSQINEAGQSLGGYLAKLGAIENNTEAFAVSAPALGDAISQLEILNGVSAGTYLNKDYSDKIFSINNTLDTISSGERQETIGKVVTFTAPESDQVKTPTFLEIFQDMLSLSNLSVESAFSKINLVVNGGYLAIKYGIALGENGATVINDALWNHSIYSTIAEFDGQLI